MIRNNLKVYQKISYEKKSKKTIQIKLNRGVNTKKLFQKAYRVIIFIINNQ